MIGITKWRMLMQQALGGVSPCSDITFIDAGGITASLDGNSISITGIQADDLVILMATSDNYSNISTPSGFTVGGNSSDTSPRSWWGYQFASGTSMSITSLQGGTGSQQIQWLYMVYRGVDTSTPIHLAETAGNTSSGQPNPPSITTTEDGCMIVALGMVDDDGAATVTQPSGFTLAHFQTSSSTATSSVGISMGAYLFQSTAGTIDPSTFTWTGGSTSDAWDAWSIALLSKCVEVFVPTQISEIPSLMYWFNPDTIDANATSDGDDITEWVDAVTSTSAPVHNFSTSNPKLRVVNGVNCVSFNEGSVRNAVSLTDASFGGMDTLAFLDNGAIVFKYESLSLSGISSTNWKVPYSKWDGTNWTLGLDTYGSAIEIALGDGNASGGWFTTSASGFQFTAGDIVIIQWSTSGSSTIIEYYINGNLIDTSNSSEAGNALNNSPLLIGHHMNDAQNALDGIHGLTGAMSHFIMFDSALTPAERTIILNEI